jgi:hypothetical protein
VDRRTTTTLIVGAGCCSIAFVGLVLPVVDPETVVITPVPPSQL